MSGTGLAVSGTGRKWSKRVKGNSTVTDIWKFCYSTIDISSWKMRSKRRDERLSGRSSTVDEDEGKGSV